MENRYWYKNAVFYEVYVRSFMDSNGDGIGDLNGLTSKIGYLKDMGVDCVWLLPVFVSPRLDDGYDIANYYAIDPDYGMLADFHNLVEEIHAQDMKIIMDLVVNHTSDQHPWFQSARADRSSPYRDYYVWSDTDRKYQDARIIFLDTEKSNWTWDEQAGQYFWHRFYSSQPDLNYDNPEVQAEMLKVMQYWLDLGIDGFRVDAVPYLFEREGTNCENLPETHAFLKRMRSYVDTHYPGKVLICEANQPPQDVVEYLGNDDEFHMAFHFPLMPKMFMGMRAHDKAPIEEVLLDTPAIPANCQWATFLRNHDELTLEMVTNAERDWMWNEYAPEPGMRLNLGIRRRLAPLLDNHPGKIELAHNLLFSMPGSPFLYYGDEIGMGDNLNLPDRDGVRTPMQWDESVNAGFSTAEELSTPVISSAEYAPERVNLHDTLLAPHSIWKKIQHLIKIRKQEKVFGGINLSLLIGEDPRVLAFRRTNEGENILFFHNMSDAGVKIHLHNPLENTSRFVDLITKSGYETEQGMLHFNLGPFQSVFLKPKGSGADDFEV